MFPVLSDAKFYRKRGLSIVPIRPGTKAAAVDWKEFQERLPTDEEIERWWARTRHGIAIVCGRVSGVIAVDCDSPEKSRELHGKLPRTDAMTRSSPGKGHLYYRIAEGVVIPTRIRLAGMLVDMKAEGSYCLAAHSIHPATGQPYERIGSWDMAKVPYFDPAWVGEAQVRRHEVIEEPDVLRRIYRATKWAEKAEAAVEHAGWHNKIFAFCCAMFQKFGLTIEQAYPIILTYASRCQPPICPKGLKHKIEDAWRKAHPEG